MDFLTHPITMDYFTRVAPWQAAVFTAILGFFATMAIRLQFENKLYFLPYSAFWIGMSLILPTMAYFISRGLQNYKADNSWYNQTWFSLLMWFVGLAACLYNSLNTQRSTGRDIWTPSEWWIWLIAGPILVAVLPRGLVALRQVAGTDSKDFAYAILCGLVYAGLILIDMKIIPLFYTKKL